MGSSHFVFAGGGTGGHLFPGIAVAHALRALNPDARITFLTTTRALDRQLLEPTGFVQVEQPVQPFSPRPWRWPDFWLAWRRSRTAAAALIRRERPVAVLGLGGYAAGPPVVAGSALGVRTAILNPDAIPGRANRYLAKHADLVVLQWDYSRRHFGPGTDCRALGCPIRATFVAADAANGRRLFGLDAGRPTLLVTGASQGARTVNDALLAVWPRFHAAHPEWQLLHLTGLSDEARIRSGYAANGAPAHVVAFTHNMAEAIAAADLVVARAGASTLAELAALGKPAILLPYPYHRDRHQHVNAGVLVEAGAALLVEDQKDASRTAPPLLAALETCAPAGPRARMAAAAATLGRPGAARDVAAWLLG